MAKAPTKSEIVAQICKDTKLSRKEVAGVFDSLQGVIKKSLRSVSPVGARRLALSITLTFRFRLRLP